VAIEHAYRTREQSPETWVFWAHASNAARLEESFRDIADFVKIVGRRQPQANIFKLVHDWLHEDKRKWLLILDNVDDASFLLNARAANLKTTAKSLREFLPHCERGSILVTTRNKEAALQLVEQRDIIALDPMDEAQSLALLARKLGAQTDKSDGADLTELTKLAAALEYMPLAIAQAAAYISQRAPLCSVAQYLDQFRKSERKRTSLLNRDGGQLRRDREAKNSIITAWQISFEHIQQVRPSAADVLSLMSFFDRQGIPRSVLQIQAKHRKNEDDKAHNSNGDEFIESHFETKDGDSENNDLQVHSDTDLFTDESFEDDSSEDDSAEDDSAEDDSAEDDSAEDDSSEDDSSEANSAEGGDSEDDAFRDDITVLRNFCLVSVNTDGLSFAMHALVQLSVRAWLVANGDLERFKERFINKLSAAFPTGEYENWAACQALFAHAKAAASYKPEEASMLVEWARLLYHAAWYALRKGSAGDVEALAVQSLKARKKILGREHEDTMWSMAMVAHACFLQGQWDAAEELQIEVLEASKKKLGADHLDTLTSMANLASTYRNQGKWDEAEELDMRVVKTRKRKLETDHPDALTSMANLASTHWHQGRWDKAEQLGVQVVEARRQTLRENHPDTLTSMANLASTYRKQGRLDEAEALIVQVAERSKTTLGADHPDTLTSTAHLALTCMKQGRWDEAEGLFMQVMETRKEKLGADHPQTLITMYNLARTRKYLERSAEAISLLQECVHLSQSLPPWHPELLLYLKTLDEWEAEEAERAGEAEEFDAEVAIAQVACGAKEVLLTQGHKHE
jgi:hypothetical protein